MQARISMKVQIYEGSQRHLVGGEENREKFGNVVRVSHSREAKSVSMTQALL